MRRIWVTCGWVLCGAGFFLIAMMGLAWLGGGAPIRMIPSIIMGCLFIFLGRTFVARGKSLPTYGVSKDSEATQNDQLAARRMIVQAIWVGGIILLTVAVVVGLLIFFTGP